MTRVVQLAYSGGSASHALLDMVLTGEVPLPAPLIVTCADPGMEDVRTHQFTREMESRCQSARIPFLRVKRNLYLEIRTAKLEGLKRFDFPAFFTRNRETGKIGKLLQGCTQVYKIAPMDRLARIWMEENLGLGRKSSRLGEKILLKWIGYTWDEAHRIKPHDVAKYVEFGYPLVDKRTTSDDLGLYFLRRGMQRPPRSVCSACFANDAAYFKEMYLDRPENWAQAVGVDDEIRDLRQFGIRDECFVYGGCVSLRELAYRGFPELRSNQQSDELAQGCHTGHCFV